MNIRKRVSDLDMEDFQNFPIWTWEDDDEYVIPITNFETIPDDHDAVFVKCEITTRSGIAIIGMVSVRMSDHSVYAISFPDESGKLMDVPLQPLLMELKKSQLNRLRSIMNTKTNELFPLKFQAPFRFSNGTPLEGEIH
jgi:hypothetical protein